MSLRTSYAQNFEDVILWRALGHVENGFYLDVGSQDPVNESVSLLFHEAGWEGVHVEPSPGFAQAMRVARPGARVIEAALAEKAGRGTFSNIVDTGLSTFDTAIAATHARNGFKVESVEVKILTLADVFDTLEGREVHWLKIDVEGAEARVIAGWPPSEARPWVVVVEAIEPITDTVEKSKPRPSHEAWEPDLLALGYDYVYFDGLNRFYVSKEHTELTEAFGPGPNLFDAFTLHEIRPGSKRAFDAMVAADGARREAEYRVARLSQANADLSRLLADATKTIADGTPAGTPDWQTAVVRMEGELRRQAADLASAQAVIRRHEESVGELEAWAFEPDDEPEHAAEPETGPEAEVEPIPEPQSQAELEPAVDEQPAATEVSPDEEGPEPTDGEKLAEDKPSEEKGP